MAEHGLPINEEATVASQVLAWLLQQEFEAGEPEWVSSRSLIDVWAYAALAADRDQDRLAQALFTSLTAVTQTEVQDRYTALVYLPPRIPLRPDVVRPHSEAFQRATDAQIRAGLSAFGISYREVDVSRPAACDEALSELQRLRERERGGREMPRP
jgi:hypothetical protein